MADVAAENEAGGPGGGNRNGMAQGTRAAVARRGFPLSPDPCRRLHHPEVLGLPRARLPGGRRLHGPRQLGDLARRRREVRLRAALRRAALQHHGDHPAALCARLAIATGRDLAQACRDAYPRWVSWPLWLLAEIAICATDLAEVIGTAIGLNLLFGIPLEIGVIITALDVFLILWLQTKGFRWIEAFIITLLGVIAVCFVVQIAHGRPRLGPGDPRLRADDRDRHQPGHAVSGARHHRRDGDAA